MLPEQLNANKDDISNAFMSHLTPYPFRISKFPNFRLVTLGSPSTIKIMLPLLLTLKQVPYLIRQAPWARWGRRILLNCYTKPWNEGLGRLRVLVLAWDSPRHVFVLCGCPPKLQARSIPVKLLLTDDPFGPDVFNEISRKRGCCLRLRCQLGLDGL